MQKLWFIVLLFAVLACNKDYKPDYGIDLDKINSISIDETVNYGVANLPSDAGSEITKYFDKYTRYVAENGQYVHFFADASISHFELARQREIFSGILKNYPNSNHGSDKAEIGNYLAEDISCIMFFSDENSMNTAANGKLLASSIHLHPILYENIFTEGSALFIGGNDVDQSMAKLMKVILKSGIANTNYGYNSEIYNASNNARSNSVWIPNDVTTLQANGELGLRYITVLLEVYYGQWQKSGIVNSGEYLYPDRSNLASDPLGLNAIEVFFHPFLPYKVMLDPDFSDDLEMEFNSNVDYTYRSQYFGEVDMSPSTCTNLTANSYNNNILGNGLDNTIIGKSGDDFIDGNDGFDIAGFTGIRNEYLISTAGNYTIVQDTVPSRDGLDTLINIERLQFQDITVDL
ncbi:MAG: hypothetical protein KDC84_06465 [Crocinitomicaceae bacterium]|nr:hypothetical protein [Crocinitomicaceae bacterium]